MLGLGWVREVRWGFERKEREERDQRGRGREIEERDQKGEEIEKERRGRGERVWVPQYHISINCHMSYLIANLTVLSQQRLK